MTCQHCCGAESIFDEKSARRDYKKYLRKGPNKTTKALIQAITTDGVEGLSLLDIGGGVGVIQQEFIAKGVTSTTDVDASTAYQNKARELASERNTLDRMQFLHGDFVDLAPNLSHHDIVTLERVVCCYPDVDRLINLSIEKADKFYALVYPRDNFLSRLLIKTSHVYLWIIRNPFRTFVHSEEMMHSIIKSHGFNVLELTNAGIWRVAVFNKTTN